MSDYAIPKQDKANKWQYMFNPYSTNVERDAFLAGAYYEKPPANSDQKFRDLPWGSILFGTSAGLQGLSNFMLGYLGNKDMPQTFFPERKADKRLDNKVFFDQRNPSPFYIGQDGLMYPNRNLYERYMELLESDKIEEAEEKQPPMGSEMFINPIELFADNSAGMNLYKTGSILSDDELSTTGKTIGATAGSLAAGMDISRSVLQGIGYNRRNKYAQERAAEEMRYAALNDEKGRKDLFNQEYLDYYGVGFQDGGEQHKTLYTTEDDPRWQSYSDSLNLWRAMQFRMSQVPPNTDFDSGHAMSLPPIYWNHPTAVYDTVVYTNDSGDPFFTSYRPQNFEAVYEDYLGVYDTPEDYLESHIGFSDFADAAPAEYQFMEYFNSLPFYGNTRLAIYPSPDFTHENINAVGSWYGLAWNPMYAKPKRKVAITRPQESTIPTNYRTYQSPQLQPDVQRQVVPPNIKIIYKTKYYNPANPQKGGHIKGYDVFSILPSGEKRFLGEQITNPIEKPRNNPYQDGGIPTSRRGLYDYPGQPVKVPSNNITMEGIDYPVMAFPDNDEPMLMYPDGGSYVFPNSKEVLEVPMFAGGGLKSSQKSLKEWTAQEWTTSDGSPSKGKKRYLPKKAWDNLSSGEKAATNRAKSQGDAEGKQFVKQPKSIAEKTAKYREDGGFIDLMKDGGSRVNEAGNYTKPEMRKRLFYQIKAGSKGGDPGEWSARKAQMLAKQYKAKGGGYKQDGGIIELEPGVKFDTNTQEFIVA